MLILRWEFHKTFLTHASGPPFCISTRAQVPQFEKVVRCTLATHDSLLMDFPRRKMLPTLVDGPLFASDEYNLLACVIVIMIAESLLPKINGRGSI